MLFNQHRRKYWEHLLVRRFVLFGLLLFPLSQSANAEVVAADAILQVLVRVDSVVDSEVPVLPGSTQSAGVSQASDIEGVIRRASSAGAATLNDASSGTLSFSGAFQKLPTNLSGGFAATSGELVYRFETDVAGTLFLETANAASFQGFGGFDASTILGFEQRNGRRDEQPEYHGKLDDQCSSRQSRTGAKFGFFGCCLGRKFQRQWPVFDRLQLGYRRPAWNAGKPDFADRARSWRFWLCDRHH